MQKLNENINTLEELKTVMEHYNITFTKDSTGYKTNCIFHNEKTPSLRLDDKGNGAYYHCFGCNKSGDIITFITNMDKCTRYEARKKAHEILGLKYTPTKIESFIKFISTNNSIIKRNNKNYKYEDSYVYSDENNNPIFIKNKYRKLENRDKTFFTKALIETEKSFKYGTTEDFDNSRKCIYNYPNVKTAIEKGHNIYFVEGEKDVENINRLGLTATTIYSKKWIEEYTDQLKGAKIVFIGDTGKSGKQFKDLVYKGLIEHCKSFKIVKLPELIELGDNKDVSDWLETGKTKDELLEVVKRTLDLKNKNELQQNSLGIYKTVLKETDDELLEKKIYITNFTIEKVKILRNKDNKDQLMDITVKSNLGTIDTIESNARELFLDVKTFNRSMGVDYTFKGKLDDLLRLKEWILRYFIDEDIEEYVITGIRAINGKNVLVTNHGLLDTEGNFNTKIKARNTIHDIDFSGVSTLSETEARTLANNLFNFNTKSNIVNSIGLGIANLYNSYARQSKRDNVPVLQNVGESNSGKSKTLTLLNLLLGNEKDSRSFGKISPFAAMKLFTETYLPLLIDEMKPSKSTTYKVNEWSNHIRSITEGYEVEKGRKDQTLISYKYNSSLILSGEEQILETAVTNRSNVVWYSLKNFTDDGASSIEYLLKNNEGAKLLKSLSKSLYVEVLNQGVEGFEIQYDICKAKIGNQINNDRVRNTATYTLMGYRLLLNVFQEFNVDVEKYISETEAIDLIVENLKENVLDSEVVGGKAEYETILELIDKVDIVKGVHYNYTRDKMYLQIDINGIWDRLSRYIKDYNVDIKLLPKETFIKMLTKSKYIYGDNFKDYYKNIRLKDQFTGKPKSRWVYKLKLEEIKKIYMPNLAPTEEDEFEEVDGIIPFK